MQSDLSNHARAAMLLRINSQKLFSGGLGEFPVFELPPLLGVGPVGGQAWGPHLP